MQQRLSRRTVTVTPPGDAQLLVLLRLGRSPPCSTFPEGLVADSSPKLGIILWVLELSTSEDLESSFTSLALSPEFVTNTLLGSSRPVGKGPGGFPRKSSTTPWERHYSRGRRGQINFTLFLPVFQRKWGAERYFSTGSTGIFLQKVTSVS